VIYDQIQQPTLIIDPHRCKANIRKITEKAVSQGFELRPHFKTHQSHLIGSWFREEGISKITVSSVGMASFFAMNDWDDITIAFPVNVRQINAINDLAERVDLGLVVEDPDTVDFLGKHLTSKAGLWIKIDVGTHRTGVAPDDLPVIDHILDRMQEYSKLTFKGFLGHAGHTYQSHNVQEVHRIHENSLTSMLRLKKKYSVDFPGIQISLGDTPGISMLTDLGDVDELRPGNFVFYDLQQEEIGSCNMDEIAVAMACPVVAVHPERNQWIIYGGGIHFAKDFLPLKDGRKCFGRFVHHDNSGWSTTDILSNPYLISLSQEHGVVQCTDDTFHLRQPGDLSLWLPVHSCMTADAMGGYLSTEGETIDHYREHLWPF
jgi:D-serine deaminase-like pyridoxal phosphate-dependent protein